MQKKIESKDISVVVQGPIHKTRTKKCLKSIRKYLSEAEIILSTWEGSRTDNLDYDILVVSKDPGAVRQKRFASKKVFNNLNRMIVSTNCGIEKASRKYTLKLRTDSCVDNTEFLNVFENFSQRAEKYKLFEQRILASTLFSKTVINGIEIPFHVSDWWFFGLTEDIKKYLLSSTTVEEPYFSNYFEYPENAAKKSAFEKFDWRFAPEQFICYSCFNKYFDDIKMRDCADLSDEINEKSRLCLANNFIFLEYKQSGIHNLKYLFSKYEPFAGDIYLELYTFHKFEELYKKYCDSAYIPASASISSNYKLLRFYKHLYKLFDPEASLRVKIEQFFVGVPFSAIALIPVLLRGKFDK